MPKPPKNGLSATGGPKGNSLAGSGSAKGGGSGGGNLLIEQLDRTVRYYKLTASEISNLGILGGLGALSFSIATAALSTYANIMISISLMADPLPPMAIIYRDKVSSVALWVCGVFALLTVILWVWRLLKFNGIKNEHKGRVGDAEI